MKVESASHVRTALLEADGASDKTLSLSIVIVTWNCRGDLETCLKSVLQGELKHFYEVIVVDNASTDGTVEWLRVNHPQVRTIENATNVGFARAVNQGFKASRGEFVFLLNADTIVSECAVNAMLDFMMSHPNAGVVGGTLVNADGSFQAGHARFSTVGQEMLVASTLGERLWPGYPVHRRTDKVEAVDWICGAALLVRYGAAKQVEFLDEEYVMYSEEVDLQYRLGLLGWMVYFLPQVETVHFGGRSQDRWKRRRWVYRGKLLFYKKHRSPLSLLGVRAVIGGTALLKLAMWAVLAVSIRRGPLAREEMASNLEVLKLCLE